MDGIQVYYLCLVILSFLVYVVKIIVADSYQKLGEAVGQLFLFIGLGLPVFGRIFRWW